MTRTWNICLALAISFLVFAGLFVAAFAGYLGDRENYFSASILRQGDAAVAQLFRQATGEDSWYYMPTAHTRMIPRNDVSGRHLNLITSVSGINDLNVSVIDNDGNVHSRLYVNWFDIWPDATHIPEADIPRAAPGTHIHGIVMLEDGDVIFNFEHLGLVRMSPCGRVVWKLPYTTHHSVHADEEGTLWVSGTRNHESWHPDYPNYKPPFLEPTVLRVSLDGEILEEYSVLDVLANNDLNGLLYMGTLKNFTTMVTGDTLHLNDVEVFEKSMPEGVFKHGDVMVSLRNISTVLVFNPDDLAVRHVSTGRFTRQHDPDFIDGNTYSVFDNNNIGPPGAGQNSRIGIMSADIGQWEIWYDGDGPSSFYTPVMGKSQWLDHGGILITESRYGRAFELDKDRNVVWEYINLVGEGRAGLVEEVQRLPNEYFALYETPQSERCGI